MPNADTILELTVHDEVSSAAVGAAMRATITGLGLANDRATRVALVVEELVTESRAREANLGAIDTVKIMVDLHGDMVSIRVVDYRIPVSSADTRILSSRKLAAMGFIDRLHIANHGKEGNVAECRIRFQAPPDLASSGAEALDESTPAVSNDEAGKVEIRNMIPADVDGLIRCIFRCYGYSYRDEIIYQPTALRRLLRSGRMRSVVAVDQGGEVIGHASMTFASTTERIPEAGRLVVDPRYRGHHFAERLAAARAGVAADNGVPGLWAECVTNHVASQRNLIHLGAVEVGLLIGGSPSDVVTAGLASHNKGRRTLLAMYTLITTQEDPAANVTARLAPKLTELAQRLGTKRRVQTAIQPGTGHTKLTLELSMSAGVAHLRIDRIGADLVKRVAAELDSLIGFELGAVHLDLPLADVAAGWSIQSLEQLGFCWATWIPAARSEGDVLRLQRVGEHAVDVEHVVFARPEGQELADWVISEWNRVRRGAGTPG